MDINKTKDALIRCTQTHSCDGCPYNEETEKCIPKVMGEALEIINSLQAENDKLTNCTRDGG